MSYMTNAIMALVPDTPVPATSPTAQLVRADDYAQRVLELSLNAKNVLSNRVIILKPEDFAPFANNPERLQMVLINKITAEARNNPALTPHEAEVLIRCYLNEFMDTATQFLQRAQNINFCNAFCSAYFLNDEDLPLSLKFARQRGDIPDTAGLFVIFAPPQHINGNNFASFSLQTPKETFGDLPGTNAEWRFYVSWHEFFHTVSDTDEAWADFGAARTYKLSFRKNDVIQAMADIRALKTLQYPENTEYGWQMVRANDAVVNTPLDELINMSDEDIIAKDHDISIVDNDLVAEVASFVWAVIGGEDAGGIDCLTDPKNIAVAAKYISANFEPGQQGAAYNVAARMLIARHRLFVGEPAYHPDYFQKFEKPGLQNPCYS